MQPFFVYGTLLPDQPNVHYWGDAALTFAPATLPDATLYDMGNYPMLIEQAGSHVRGAVVTVRSDAYARVLAAIDRLETYDPQDPAGSMYVRVQRVVVLDSAEKLTAWTYLGKLKYVQEMQPLGADWVTYAASKEADIEAWWQRYKDTPNASLFE